MFLLSLFVVLVVIVYYIFSNIRQFSIFDLFGVSRIRTWYTIIGKTIIKTFVISSSIILLITFTIHDVYLSFIIKTLALQITNLIIITVLSFCLFLFMKTMNINKQIKNKSLGNSAFLFNMIVKIILSVFLVYSIGINYITFHTQSNYKANYEK